MTKKQNKTKKNTKPTQKTQTETEKNNSANITERQSVFGESVSMYSNSLKT